MQIEAVVFPRSTKRAMSCVHLQLHMSLSLAASNKGQLGVVGNGHMVKMGNRGMIPAGDWKKNLSRMIKSKLHQVVVLE
jgi:hypothetical protein